MICSVRDVLSAVSNNSKKQSFWTTTLGILTKIAAIIGGIATLIGAVTALLGSMGYFTPHDNQAPPQQNVEMLVPFKPLLQYCST